MQISERSYGMKGVGPFYVLERHFLRVSFCLSKQPFLKAPYLETLSVGKHTLAIVSETGTAETEFTIKAAAVADDTAVPQTGAGSNVALWIAVMLAAGTALTGTVLYSRKRKYSK